MALDFGNGAAGAATGAYAGSSFGPWGTAVGALTGGIAGLFGSKKKKKKMKKTSTFDSQQQGVYNDYVSSIRGEGPLKDLYNFDAEGYNNVFDQTVARPAYRNYQENIVPGITGQFRKNNLMNSSYTGEALARSGRDVQEGLDAQRSQNVFQGQQQANTNKQNAVNNLLNMQTFAVNKPQEGNGSPIDQILNSLAPDAGKWLANYIAGLQK